MGIEKFDVVIMGGGNAGMGVTVPTREAGLSVAMVENRDLGGVCPNRGCTPKKVLVAAGHALHEIERAGEHRISLANPRLDWAGLIDREKEMIRSIPERLARAMADRGVEVVRGNASFAGPNLVKVGERMIEAGHIVIATGSRPRDLPIEGKEHLATSDDALSDRTLAEEIVFVGGGVIALEFGHVFARAGAAVTILEVLPRLLGEMDEEAVERVRVESERIGIRIRTKAIVRRIDKVNGRFQVSFEEDGRPQTIHAGRVYNGAGRIADVGGLDLEKGNVAHKQGRIEVDAYLRSTSNPSVHVCGDALWSSPQLSPIATYEGQIVGRNIVEGPSHRPDYSCIPACVYTVPALASVGLTEAKAKEKGVDFEVRKSDMLSWFSARTYAETVAWAKLIVERKTRRILGAQMVGHAGEELIHIFALAMGHGITADALKNSVYGFPTFAADIKNMV